MRYHAPSHAERCVDDTVCRPLQLSDQRTHDSQTRWSFRSLTIQERVFLRVLVAGEVRDDDLPFLQIFLQSDPCSLARHGTLDFVQLCDSRIEHLFVSVRKLKFHHGRGQVTENVELDLELGVDLLDAVVREPRQKLACGAVSRRQRVDTN